MLEVTNGFLLIYFTVLTALSSIIPLIVKPVAGCFARPSREERTIWAEILDLKSQQKGLSMKDDFAAYSKLQRKILKLETELKKDRQSRVNRNVTIKSTLQVGCQIVIAFILLCSVIWFRKEPIVNLNANLTPLSTVLSYPSGQPNAISSHMWVVISRFSIKSLLKPVLG